MECKAQRPYTVEHFANGNTGWRCLVCGKIVRLIPGKYREPDGLGSAEAPACMPPMGWYSSMTA